MKVVRFSAREHSWEPMADVTLGRERPPEDLEGSAPINLVVSADTNALPAAALLSVIL